MNKRQENKLTAYESVLELFGDNPDVVQSIAGLTDSVSAFRTTVADVKSKSIEKDGAVTGKTTEKYNTEDGLISCLLPVCSVLYLLGRKQGNARIMEFADVTESRLRKMRDTELSSYGAAAADTASENAEGLAAFGITPEKITDIRTRADAYSRAIGQREKSIADRKGASETLAGLFDSADDILDNELDRFIEMVRPANVEFYNKYFAARVIKDTGIRHRQPEPAPEGTNGKA